MAIVKADALYVQVANEMRASILSGAWAPGSQIPREEQLAAEYDVSRPTVRQAVASLRTEGLLDVFQGKGSFVRDRQAQGNVTMDQDITRSGTRYTTGATAWTAMEAPVTVQLRIDAQAAVLLEITEGEAAYMVECPLLHPDSGTRALHRMILPLERITGTPLAKNAAVTAAKAYAILATAHGDLQWRETVGARMPQPDERSSLRLGDGIPLLISQRLTLTQADQRPLILETTSLGAGGATFAYTLHATTKTRRSTPQPPN
ncbi:GntR family transcriptional regulator [Streptacidiphilus sp. N1-3]|uniref:GntR family transcriptional regulator n=1 Tax=Streptacidiphilus alkalitolerans TaxID=3342712 RepID=A0ABV6XE79_9ACTN